MRRREFLKTAAAAITVPAWSAYGEQPSDRIDLRDCAIVVGNPSNARETLAATVLVEEVEKRCGIKWPTLDRGAARAKVCIYLVNCHWAKGTGSGAAERLRSVLQSAGEVHEDGFLVRSGNDAEGRWIVVIGADDRGVLFGVGHLLRSIHFGRQQAQIETSRLNLTSNPRYRLRGHQLGYRPKTNSYDGWTVAIWDQYIRDLALFGTNAVELVPPRSDDRRDSPHFPLPPERMMMEMSRIADSYGLDVWIWYPALDKDYGSPQTVEFALAEWGRIFAMLPRVDAVFVPGGDPGSTPPQYLFALLEKQKTNLRKHHPKAEMWVSSQGFDAEQTKEFLSIIRRADTQAWLDGIVFGPMSRFTIDELRREVPQKYPIRCYPDITHSVWCQYPVPNWDIAYALTEGREVINPRPKGQATILKQVLPSSIGFISYSEGCNDDVNKFVWSALAWDPGRAVIDVLREYARYFIGDREAEGFAHGLLDLEANWRGPLATNTSVETTLERFRDMESAATPAVLESWRFQQALFRSYFDAFVRRRLLDEMAHVQRARDVLERTLEIGWAPVIMGASPPAKDSISNGFDPEVLLLKAQKILEETVTEPAAAELRARVKELGEALFQTIHMQLAVDRYQGEAVRRGANLDTLDHPVTDTMWLRRQIIDIRKKTDPVAQLAGIRSVLFRTDPGPGGFYDELGNVSNRPHLIVGQEQQPDPDFRCTPLAESMYPDTLQDSVPIAWKHFVQSQYDAPIRLHYRGLDPGSEYHLRIVYAGDEPRVKIRLLANEQIEIHPYLLRSWPPAAQEFPVPREATATGELALAWFAEPGGGADGRGCQVAEVFLMRSVDARPV